MQCYLVPNAVLIKALCFATCLCSGLFFGTPKIHAQEERQQPQLWNSNQDAAQLRFFESKIRPILAEHCYDCHSSQVGSAEAELSLDTRHGLFTGGVSGKPVIPGKPNSSLLLIAIQQNDRHLIMPPVDAGEKLSPSVIKDFQRWISSGAYYPSDNLDPAGNQDGKTDGGKTSAGEINKWWAWQPPRAVAIPDTQHKTWAANDIDVFVLSRLEENGLSPAPPADRHTLVRRLAIDLTGLPPSQLDLAIYASADSTKPLSDLVDKYLASDRFGERFGRHWLDVARYAESTGKDVNLAYPYAWRYRDYVIDAFNSDKPFKEFIFEQIAGDLMPARSAQERGERMIATGFLAIGPKSINEMNPLQFAVDVADEQIDTFSQAFLGVTIACARCHDHKFDPITQADYTALAGIMLSTQTHFGTTGGVAGRNRSTLLDLPSQFSTAEANDKSLGPAYVESLQTRIADLESQQRELARLRRRGEAEQSERLKNLRIAQQLGRLKIQLESVDEQGQRIPKAMGVSDKQLAPSQTAGFMNRGLSGRTRLQSMLAERMSQNPNAGRARLLRELQYIGDSPQYVRGEIDKPGDRVPRGLPNFLANGSLPTISSDESGRLELAAWLTSDQNPLTARVIVNRVWSWLLGEGIVASEDNFGTSGEQPSHPALLDHLAIEFVRENWSVKTLVRQIVLSSTYQQSSKPTSKSSEIDPDNRLLSHANRRALDAECLRDGMLMISGGLNLDRPLGSLISEEGDGPIGGRRLGGISEQDITQIQSNARSVYLPIARNVLPSSLEIFDFADNSAVLGQREMTIVPSQALYWMNSESVEEHCQKTADLLLDAVPFQTFARHPAALPRRGQRFMPRRWQTNVDLPPTEKRSLNDEQVEDLLNKLTLQVLSRPALDAEIAAVTSYVSDQQRQDRPQREIWKGIVRSFFSSADYRFLR